MAGPWEKYRGGGVVASMPGTGPKPESGYRSVSPTEVAPLIGGSKDPNAAAALAAAEARARAAASTPIEVGGQITAARAKAAIELENERKKASMNILTPEARSKLQAQLAGAQGLTGRIGEIESRFRRDMSATGLEGLKEYLPGQIRPENQQFNDAGRSLMGDLAAAYGLTAQQQNTPTELEIRFGPFIPRASDRDDVIRSKIARLKEVAASQGAQARQQLGVPGQKSSGPARIKGDADYNALPSGATFIGPDGKTRRKP